MIRRTFIKTGLLGTAALASELKGAAGSAGTQAVESGESSRTAAIEREWTIGLFTDFVDDAEYGFSYQDLAGLLAPLEITGPDLTVRRGGFVTPERVSEELPRAAAVLRDEGLSIPMISTGIRSLQDQAARPTLETAALLGIPYFKLGYYHYENPAEWQSEIESIRKRLNYLIAAARREGIQALFHTHSGNTVGGAMWDLWELLEPVDPAWIGAYFDPSHATIEGGKHGWIMGFHRLAPRMKAIAVKDFVWEKISGRWQTRWCPLGEGMVDWPNFFKKLAQIDFRGPISVSIEYDPGGTTKSARLERSLAAAERDVNFLKSHLKSAFG